MENDEWWAKPKRTKNGLNSAFSIWFTHWTDHQCSFVKN